MFLWDDEVGAGDPVMLAVLEREMEIGGELQPRNGR